MPWYKTSASADLTKKKICVISHAREEKVNSDSDLSDFVVVVKLKMKPPHLFLVEVLGVVCFDSSSDLT